MSLYRKHNDPSEIQKQAKLLEFPLEHAININNHKNPERCEKDGDLDFEKRVTVDSYLKQVSRKSGLEHDTVEGPSCTNAGACSGQEITQSAETNMKIADVKSVNPAICFPYHNYVEHNMERPQINTDWMANLQINN